MDPIPVLSQLKSLTQFIFGESEQARQTQINFSRQCPIISQARSAVEAMKGDKAAARETQLECLRFLGGVVDSIPVVGHISGGIHYAVGDKTGGDQAMKAASHTTAVMAGGMGGLLIGGPVGAIGLGIGAGLAMDSTITVIDTAVHWKEDRKVRTFGFLEPFSDPKETIASNFTEEIEQESNNASSVDENEDVSTGDSSIEETEEASSDLREPLTSCSIEETKQESVQLPVRVRTLLEMTIIQLISYLIALIIRTIKALAAL